MPLKAGYTRFHGVVVLELYADRLRYLERRLRKAIDEREPFSAQYELQRFKDFAGDSEQCRTIFEIVRLEADDRWRENFGASWCEDIAAASSTEGRRIG